MLYTRHCRRIITYHKYNSCYCNCCSYLVNGERVYLIMATQLLSVSVRRLHHEFLCCSLYFVQLTAALMYALCWYRWCAITLVYGKFRKLALQANNIPAWPGHSSMHTSCSAAIMVWLLQLGRLINQD